MGTNYYVVPNRPSVAEPIHIGKSSAGWMFLFHDVEERYREPEIIWHTYEQVMDWLETYTVKSKLFVIMDEYDCIVPFDRFKNIIDLKQKAHKDNPDNFIHCKNVNGYRFEEREFS